jgi:di/tricarboxylate transporter
MSQIGTKSESKYTLWTTVLKLAIVAGIPILVYISLADSELGMPLRRFISLTVWAVLAWITEIIPGTMIGISLPALYVIFGVSSPAVAFSPWYGTVPWLTTGGLIVGHMLLETGLANRIAYSTIYMIGGSFRQIMAGLMVAGFILAPLVPSTISKMSIFCVFAIGICQGLNFRPGTPEAAAIMLTAFFSVSIPAMCFLTGSGHIPPAVYIMQQTSGIEVTWSQYAMHNVPVGIVYALATLILVGALFKTGHGDHREIIGRCYQALGPMTRKEQCASILLVIILGLLATDTLHHLSPSWIMLLAAAALFVPGINLLQQDDLRKIDFLIVFFVSGAMSIGAVAADIGAAQMLADQLMPLINGSTVKYTLVAAYMFGWLLLFFVTPMTGLSTFAGPLSTLAMNVGLDPRLTVYSFIYGMDQAVFPYQYALLLLVFKTGYVTRQYLLRLLLPKVLVGGCVLLLVALPYWALLGLW